MRGVTLHLHIRRLVIDAGSPGVDEARLGTLTEALRTALLEQLTGELAAGRAGATPSQAELSLPQRIAAGILHHDTMRPARDRGAGAPAGKTPVSAGRRRRP